MPDLPVSVTPSSSTAPIKPWEVLDLLAGLVQKSLVLYEEDERGQGRYRLLETVRQYARDRLLEVGEGEAVRARHRDWFLALAEQAEPKLSGLEPAFLDRLEREHDNLRAALAWSGVQEQGEAGLRLGGTLWHFWHVRGYWTEGREHLAGLLAPGAQTRTAARAKALRGAGWLARRQGDYGAARALHEESLAIFREQGDKDGIAWSLLGLGIVASEQRDYVAARALFEEGLAIFREQGDRYGVAWSLNRLGFTAREQGEYEAARALSEESLAVNLELHDKQGIAWSLRNLGWVAREQEDAEAARALFEESLALSRELGEKRGIAWSLNDLGFTTCEQGDYGTARALLEESLAINRELGDKRGIAQNLEGLAAVAGAETQPERAARLFGAAEALREAIGAPRPPAEQAEQDRSVAAVRAALGDAAFAAAWAEGRAMGSRQAIEYAMEPEGTAAGE